MSGREVISGISDVIKAVDASVRIYNNVREDAELPQAFTVVGRQLPLILQTLQTCQHDLEPLQASLSPEVCTVLEHILDGCDHTAAKLKDVFERVIPGDSEGFDKRYRKILKRLGNGSKVEDLMITITEDVQLMLCHHPVRSGGLEQLAALDGLLKMVKSVESSAPDVHGKNHTFHSGGGAQVNNLDHSTGQQVNNNAVIGAQYFGSNRD